MSAARDQAGFSLVEMVAALALMTVILGAALGLAFQSQARSSDRSGEQEARQLSRISLARMVAEARLAGYRAGDLPPIDIAEPARLRFAADIDDGDAGEPCTAESPIRPRAEQITFELREDGTLRRGVRCRNSGDTAWVGPTTWTPLAEGLDSSAAFFRFFDADGNELGDGTTPLTAADREQVRSIRIGFDLSLDDPGRILGNGDTSDFAGTEHVTLRNLVLLN